MSTPTVLTPGKRSWRAFIVISLIALVLALRLNAGLGRDLWEDEIIATSHAEQPLWRLPVAVMASDVHPFLYFLQLHFWEQCGEGEIWLRLNSVLWNLLAIASLFVVVSRTYDRRTAWIAGPLFALSAPVVWMAQELRPYSWIYCLLIWAFYFIERPFQTGGQTRLRDGVVAAVLCVAIIYSHAIGFLAVLLLGLYALARHLQVRSARSAVLGWVSLFGACALAGVPPLLTDLLRDANLGGHASVVSNLSDWLPSLLLPAGDQPLMRALAGGMEFAVIVLCATVAQTRIMALTLMIMPILLALALHASGHAIFKLNIFSTMITPFFVISLSRLLAGRPAHFAWTGACIFGVLFTCFSLAFFAARTPTTGFLAASRIIRGEIKSGDVVYVPQPSMFDGMARYMGVAERGWQLRVAPVPSPQWQRLYDRLGQRFVAIFGLAPRTQTIFTPDGIPMVVGPAPALATARRLWLVTYKRADLPAGFPPAAIGGRHLTSTRSVNALQISLYQPP